MCHINCAAVLSHLIISRGLWEKIANEHSFKNRIYLIEEDVIINGKNQTRVAIDNKDSHNKPNAHTEY